MINPERAKERMRQTWCDGWQQLHLERILATGVSSVAEFLRKHPAEPYHKLGRHIGNVVAAVQFQELQFHEAVTNGWIREACKELLVRTLNDDLKYGWQKGQHWRFNRSGAYAHFLNEIRGDKDNRDYGERVWVALVGLNPPPEWVPKSIDDPLIEKAFDIGWPTGQG